MNYTELHDAISKFPVEEIMKERKPLYAARSRFVKAFSRENIESMTVDEYIEGKGNKDTFCYGLERTLDGLGRITGATSSKFGVYYSKKEGKYIPSKKYGDTYRSAFKAVKEEILALLDAGEKGDTEALVKNRLSPMFKGKILATYYPDDYLNVFDNDHLTHYLRILNRDTEELVKADAVVKREALVKYKNEDPEMKEWNLDIFGKFLYHNFPPKASDSTSTNEEVFPTTDKFSFVELELEYTKQSTEQRKKGLAPKTDYEKEARKYRKRGERGEHIVMGAEIKRLQEELGYSPKQAEKAVTQVSEKSDSYGYDIKSVNADGSPRYIEVKATTGKVGDMDFYYTQNEYEKAMEYKENYYIYIVYEIKSLNPKIWMVKNPFLYGELEMRPVQYKVSVHTKD